MAALPVFSSRVRAFREEDIPTVADLHRKVFGLADRMSEEMLQAYRAYFSRVFFDHPWRDLSTESLVYQEGGSAITGFLGLVPRRLTFEGRLVHAKIVTQFVVAPESRGMAGMKLLRAGLSGPEDLTFTDEANSDMRRLWEGLGGATSLLHSMHWIYPLRPVRLAEQWLAKRTGPARALLLRLGAAMTWWLDPLLARMPGSPFQLPVPQLKEEELDEEDIGRLLADEGDGKLRPQYDRVSLGWTLEQAERLAEAGGFQKVLVRTAEGEFAGWYLYYARRRGLSEVIHLHANRRREAEVLEHMFWHAWQRGAAGLSGRMEPALAQALSDRRCLYHCGPQWFLVHSRRPELLRAFEQGRTAISRLDGEWCLHFM